MKGQTSRNILESKLQRRLRKSMTDAERRLWRSLQRKQLNGLKFRRQHPFGDYIIDFVCLKAKLAVEIDGGQHAESGIGDAARTKYLEHAGFRVLRFWNHDVLRDTESVVETILGTLLDPTPPPSQPSP
jgi:very-short-patch-repair endonuclease